VYIGIHYTIKEWKKTKIKRNTRKIQLQ